MQDAAEEEYSPSAENFEMASDRARKFPVDLDIWTTEQSTIPSSHTDHHITHQHICHMLTVTCQKYSCRKCIYFRVKDKVSGRASRPPKVTSLVDFKIRIIQDLKSGCSCLANFKIRISQELK